MAFRYLIYFFTWLAAGRAQFGQDGHAGSSHLPWLGLAFFVVIPAVGGLVYGPMTCRYAREARGHGVPEVMIAVAGNGGRIRPRVSVVKAVASAVCIGTGGSVGREGPIVQIGSALASAFGQWAKMPENRMRILVACGAAGGISATFNAPVTGVFFGVEIILREFSVDALFTVMLSAMLADVAAIGFLGDRPFLTGFPPGVALHHPRNYLLVALLAVAAALIGMAFKAIVYKMEDLWDAAWGKRPEWARPAVGGMALAPAFPGASSFGPDGVDAEPADAAAGVLAHRDGQRRGSGRDGRGRAGVGQPRRGVVCGGLGQPAVGPAARQRGVA